MERVSPGQAWHPPRATDQNNITEATEEYLERRRLGIARPVKARPLLFDRVLIRNDSGGDVVAGRALEIGDKLLTDVIQEYLWFSGEMPDPDGTKLWGVAHKPIPGGEIGDLMTVGNAVARVTVGHALHRYADVVASSTTLVSGWHGVPIMRKQSGTGTFEDCVLKLGAPFYGPIKAVVTEPGGIDPNGTGLVSVWYGGVDTGDEVEASFEWIYGTEPLGEGQRVRIQWLPDEQIFEILEPWC